MKGAVAPGVDPDNVVSINTDGIFQSLSQLAGLNIPTADEAVHRILACFKFGENTDSTVTRNRQQDATIADKGSGTTTAKKRTADEKSEERRATEERNKTREDKWQCKVCDKVFSSKSYLDRHFNNEHSAKRRRLVQYEIFECDDCDCVFTNEADLKEHETTHASASNGSKPTKYKCDLCDKERSGIYIHYKSMHKIEYPEQILFYNGNALVRSAIDSKGGKAPWFINEKENVTKRYKIVTCRLCESEPNFDDAEMLEAHYMLIHMVNPELLNNLNFLFRAAKGSHLGLSASNPKHRVISSIIREADVPSHVKRTENGKIKWVCKFCNGNFSSKGNLHRHVLNLHGAKNVGKRAFHCNNCDEVFNTEILLNQHKNDKHIAEDKGSSKKDICTLCHKKIAAIYKHYGNVHNIEYPEQIMIENGNVLVRSNIDTQCGLAPWFIKEKAKMQTLKPSTCRLCETEYGNSTMLKKHYRSDHLVIPDALRDLQYMFRAAKGAHLADLPTSQTPSRRKHRVQSCPNQSNPRGMDNKTEINSKNSIFGADYKNKKLIILLEKKDVNGMIIYQCEECEVATSTYDASVEHAQLHHLKHYRPITETCQVCKLAFELQCFADHSSNYNHDNERKILKYNPSNLLNNDWFNIFQGLPETVANQITYSSVYKYTRAVKINSDEISKIPLFQCGICELYVHPQEVAEHCNDENACIRNKSQDYFCPECDIFFYSSVAITEHYKEHKNGRDINSFRKAIFNCRQDTTINKALQVAQRPSRLLEQTIPRDNNIQRPVEVSPVEIQNTSRSSIEIIENRPVNEFCAYCKKFIMNSEFEAHAATHKSYQNILFEDDCNMLVEEGEKENSLGAHEKECTDVASQNKAAMPVRSNDGSVEQWNSDSDSCSLNNYSYDVQVQVHVVKEDVDEVLQSNHEQLPDTNNQSNYSENISENSTQIEGINSKRRTVFDDINVQVEINDCFSEEMVNNLKMDLQDLFSDTGSDTSKVSSSQEYLTTHELLNILESNTTTKMGKEINKNEGKVPAESENAAISQDIFASDPIENQKGSNVETKISMDISNKIITNQTNNSVINSDTNIKDNSNNNDSVNVVIDTINLDDDEDEDTTESNSRPSSRDILSKMLTEDDTYDRDADDEANRENERQRLIEDTKRIRELMFSRD